MSVFVLLNMITENNRCGILEVASVVAPTWHLVPHIEPEFISIQWYRKGLCTILRNYACNSHTGISSNYNLCNRNTWIIKACIHVNLCNSDMRTWTNSIHVMVIQVYEITVFGVIEHPCNGDTSTWNNGVKCNKCIPEIQCLVWCSVQCTRWYKYM